MKTIIQSLSILMLMLVITSCTSDDNNQVTTLTDADVIAEWQLIEINSDPAIDIENDGTTDTNLMLQTTCFDGWGLDFDANGTLTADYAEIEIDPNAIASLICTPQTDTGTYNISGNNLTVSATIDGTTETQTIAITITNNVMSILVTESDITSFFAIPDGEIYSELVSLEFVLQKVN